mmetsp:Transcript_29509/g.68037  ORF Transcript_29509/g.68037 Transcript_29509/m.68037 type:complete len:597 (-) Transcript_29509:279-2069(-)
MDSDSEQQPLQGVELPEVQRSNSESEQQPLQSNEPPFRKTRSEQQPRAEQERQRLAEQPFWSIAHRPLPARASSMASIGSALRQDAPCIEPETSPAYKALFEAGLIVEDYKLADAADLDIVTSNSTISTVICYQAVACLAVPVLGVLCYPLLVKEFCVKDGHIRCGSRGDGTYMFFGPGVHRIVDLYLSVESDDTPITESMIMHGDRTIATVPQGFVGLAFDRGQPVILPPGLHQWKSDTLKLAEMVDLSAAVLRIGPFTLLTVDEGYAAVTQDNGKQKVLDGGHTHMLTHRNWKFESFISLKIHTDDLGPFHTTTADNVVLSTTAMVNWRIAEPWRAARMAANTMLGVSLKERRKQNPNANPVLKQDVLKQALASLAAAIGNIRYSGSTHISANESITSLPRQLQNKGDASPKGSDSKRRPSKSSEFGTADTAGLASIFSVNQMASAVRHANEICSQYGVCIVSINVVSASPVDQELTKALSAGAVASASAEQAETAAQGTAKAKLIASQASAESVRLNAQASADAERLKAQGKKDAAALLEGSKVAVDLAKIERAGELMSEKARFFFGASSTATTAMLANPKLTDMLVPLDQTS